MLDVLNESLESELEAYGRQAVKTAGDSYGAAAKVAVEHIIAIIAANSYHWPGILTLVGYQLEGGRDQVMIVQAARAIELWCAAHRLQQPLAAETARQQAIMTIANLDSASEISRLRAISICARSSLLLAHNKMPDADFVNPMHVGMVLANADCSGTDDITPFAKALYAQPKHALMLAWKLEKRWPDAGLLAELANRRLIP